MDFATSYGHSYASICLLILSGAPSIAWRQLSDILVEKKPSSGTSVDAQISIMCAKPEQATVGLRVSSDNGVLCPGTRLTVTPQVKV